MKYCLDLPHWVQHLADALLWLYGFLKDWQTLIAAGVAFYAAYKGVKAIYEQTWQVQKLAQDEISRRHNAACCVLPLALAEISTLCQSMADQIAKIIETNGLSSPNLGHGVPIVNPGINKFDPITVPPDALKAFKDFVETLTDASDVAHVRQLMVQIQILIARWNQFDLTQICHDIRLTRLLIDIAKVNLLNDTIYNYARMTDHENFSIIRKGNFADIWDDIYKKAEGLFFNRPLPDLFRGNIKRITDEEKGRNQSPWPEKLE